VAGEAQVDRPRVRFVGLEYMSACCRESGGWCMGVGEVSMEGSF
jgi:hypothetical protein